MIFPSAGDLFYLRMILLHKKGACNFKDLRTIDGIVYDNYFEACKALNLIEDDEIWIKTLQEAIGEYGQRYIILLFGYILVFNEVNDPRKLWEQFKDQMDLEYKHKYNLTD